MRTATQRPLVRTIGAAATIVLLGACSAEVKGPSGQDARDAGRAYGETIAETVGSRASAEEMEDLCGQGARQEATKGEKNGGEAQIDAFVDGCREAVADK